jgi:hypothetical protein
MNSENDKDDFEVSMEAPLNAHEVEEIRAKVLAGEILGADINRLIDEVTFLRDILNMVLVRLEHVEQKLGTDLSKDNPEAFVLNYGRFIRGIRL